MRFLSRSMIICPLPAIFSSCSVSVSVSVFANDQNQLALQMAALADAVRLGGILQTVAGDRRRPDRGLGDQLLHPLEMGTIARDPRAQHLDVVARRGRARRRRRNPYQ